MAAVVCGVSVGRVLYALFGNAPLGYEYGDAFLGAFLDSIYPVLLPMVILCTLSVTVYCVPAALLFLFLRSVSDGRRLFTLAHSGLGSVGIFLFAVHVFYIYGFLLLAMRCLGHRTQTRALPSAVGTLFKPEGLCFLRDFTSLAGLLTICGFYSFTVTYFL